MKIKKDNATLIKNVLDNNCSKSLMLLYGRYEKMFYNISNRILSQFPLEHSDFEGRKLSILFDAVKTFNPSKNVKFSTWLFNCIKYACLNLSKNSYRRIDMEDKDIFFFMDKNFSLNSKDTCSIAIEQIKEFLSDFSDLNAKKVIQLRYFSDSRKPLNYSEIGKILNVTPQTALNWHNKFINFAKKKLTIK